MVGVHRLKSTPNTAQKGALAPRLLIGVLGLWPAGVRAEPTLNLILSGPREILAGDPKTASVDASGRITLGWQLQDRTEALGYPVLGLSRGPQKGIYVGTAGGGLVLVSPKGKKRTLDGTGELAICALAQVGRELYYGANPRGGIWRLSSGSNKSKPFYKPTAKYVWAMAPDPKNKGVYVATGEPGEVLHVRSGGRVRKLLEPNETHIRTLLNHPTRGLIAGGGQKGIVYQIRGHMPYALYDSKMEETTALAFDPERQDLYAAFVSESKPGAFLPGRSMGPVKDDAENNEGSPIKGSEVVRITPTGRIDVLFSSKREGALGLSFDRGARRLYIATGAGPKERARVYAVEVEDRDRLVLVSRMDAPVVTSMMMGNKSRRFVVGTSPSGQVMQIGPARRDESTYVSKEQDLGSISAIGRVSFEGTVPESSSVRVFVRTGNTEKHDKTWSAWSRPATEPEGRDVRVPEGRYAQFRVILSARSPKERPFVKLLRASVMRMNVAPKLNEVFVLPRGIYMRAMPKEVDKEKTLTLTPSALSGLRRGSKSGESRTRVRQGFEKGMMTGSWHAEDANGDALLYRVEMRRLDGTARPWAVLEEAQEHPFVSFDARAYPDGRYQLRVTTSDRPSNPPDRALTDQSESEPFYLDNTPPEIVELHVKTQRRGRVRIEAKVQDRVSPINVAEFSVNGGPWLMLPARDGLLDAKQETLEVDLGSGQGPGGWAPVAERQTVVVRVKDAADNQTVRSAFFSLD